MLMSPTSPTNCRLLDERDALLTIEEVLAVRLYSGPAYKPINEFLRDLGQLKTSRHQELLGQSVQHTFAATVKHLSCALRKLAAVATPEEARRPLWRGVHGRLPDEFWGNRCAVEMGFMSTSRKEQTAIDYADPKGPNVLWCLRPTDESDAAFHCGADIAALSQFSAEEECLFPPCTMLEVVRDPSSSNRAHRPALRTQPSFSLDQTTKNAKDEDVRITRVLDVRPSFV